MAERRTRRKRWIMILGIGEDNERPSETVKRWAQEASVEVVTYSKPSFCCWASLLLAGTRSALNAFDDVVHASGAKWYRRMPQGAFPVVEQVKADQ